MEALRKAVGRLGPALRDASGRRSVSTSRSVKQSVPSGAREEALLAEDRGLDLYESKKAAVASVQRVGDVAVLFVVGAAVYDIYTRVTAKTAKTT